MQGNCSLFDKFCINFIQIKQLKKHSGHCLSLAWFLAWSNYSCWSIATPLEWDASLSQVPLEHLSGGLTYRSVRLCVLPKNNNTQPQPVLKPGLLDPEANKLVNQKATVPRSCLTFAQMLAALTTGNLASALGSTVILIPGNIFWSLSWYFSATPTVST